MTIDNARHLSGMEAALVQARQAASCGEPPFGVVILDAAGRVLAADHDRVRERRDMSAHGPDLSGSTLYTTCEPCPMCYTAAWLAHVGTIVFGTTMARVHERVGGQQRELRIPVETINGLHAEPLRLVGGIAADQCLQLFSGGSVPDRSADTKDARAWP